MRKLVAKRRGFTLVEIMVVVFIIAVLVTLALPSWMNARARAQTRTCVANLRRIHQAKETYALTTRSPNGTAISMNDLVPTYLQAEPFCPAGGGAAYSVNAIGTPPTCPTGLPNHSIDWTGD
ncbi:MAG: prepilin-type N-terminal cleavage/methylation domain-containing protein [Fimbriimonadales bacterium]|nr:prepilin-type N-terminal cleavage/methylation domain-containing protein [Fimbriimonadales bacterium]